MKHFTDNQISRYWAGGPPNKEAFLEMQQHMQECPVCRDRAWDHLAEMQKQHRAMQEGLGKLVKGLFGGLLASDPDDQKMIAKEVGEAVFKAIERIQKDPIREDWDAEDLFDLDRFDDIAHVSRCSRCRGVWEAIKATAEKATVTESVKADPAMLAAAQQLLVWVKARDVEIKDHGEVEPSSPSDGDAGPRHFCA